MICMNFLLTHVMNHFLVPIQKVSDILAMFNCRVRHYTNGSRWWGRSRHWRGGGGGGGDDSSSHAICQETKRLGV